MQPLSPRGDSSLAFADGSPGACDCAPTSAVAAPPVPAPAVLADDPDGAWIDGIVSRINEIVVQRGLATALLIGQLVLDEFFDGDWAAFQLRDPRKENSLRKLQGHKGLLVSAATLGRYLQVCHQVQHMDADLARRLPLRAHEALLLLPSDEQREAIARRAVRDGWSTRRTEEEVRSARGDGFPARRRGQALRRFAERLDALFAGKALDSLADEGVAGLSGDVLESALASLHGARSEMDDLIRFVATELAARRPR